MKLRLIILSALLFAFGANCKAAGITAGTLASACQLATADEKSDTYKNAKPEDRVSAEGFCYGYISGSLDVVLSVYSYDPEKKSAAAVDVAKQFTPEDAAKALVEFVQRQPDAAKMPAAFVLVGALNAKGYLKIEFQNVEAPKEQ